MFTVIFHCSEYPEIVTLSSAGIAGLTWSQDMGVYVMVPNLVINSRPVWAFDYKDSQDPDHRKKYIYYTGIHIHLHTNSSILVLDNSFWNVGLNYSDLFGSIVSATHENVELLGIDWVYTDAKGWNLDPTLSVTGKNKNIENSSHG